MTSPQPFKLDRSVFNATLYSSINDFWFTHLPPGASASNEECDALWWGLGQTQAEKAAFDEECRRNFGHALESVGPEEYALPAFESYDREIENAEALSQPFLDDVKDAQALNEKKGADTLLALLLLFDQMARNIYRDPAGLKLVFGHYDRIAFSLLYASMRLKPSPLDNEEYLRRPVIRQPCLIPLMHSEHLPSHDMYEAMSKRSKAVVDAADDHDASALISKNIAFLDVHREPLQQFGRYPHRNHALERSTTKEEEQYLETAQTFGVKQKAKTGEDKDEL